MKTNVLVGVLTAVLLTTNFTAALVCSPCRCPFCVYDSDGGNNQYTPGYVTAMIPGWPNPVYYTARDTCTRVSLRQYRLTEYYCNNGVIASTTYSCACRSDAEGNGYCT